MTSYPANGRDHIQISILIKLNVFCLAKIGPSWDSAKWARGQEEGGGGDTFSIGREDKETDRGSEKG